MSAPGTLQPTTTAGLAKVVYFLYLASLLLAVTSIVGLVMAYANKGDAPDWLQTHYRYQIRTFWIGLLWGFVVLVSVIIWPLFLLMCLFTLVWLVVRCTKGIKHLDRQEAVPNPAAWLF